MPRWTRWGLLAFGLIVLGTAPSWIDDSYWIGVLILGYLYGVFASSWDFMSGQTGRENFGHAMFVGGGAYTAAFLNTKYGVSPWWSLPAGGGVAVVIGLALGFMLVVATILVLLARSPWGLLLRSIRGDEAAAQAAGVNTTLHKIGALLVSAFFAGMGGAFYAHYQLQVGPTLFSITVSITVVIMSYVGGIGSVYGALGGAFVLTLMTEQLRRVGEYRLLFYTLVLISILFFLPRGLIAPLWRHLRKGGPAS